MIVAAAVMLAPTPTFADTTTISDDNDTRGRFDIRSVSASHTGTRLIHWMQMFDPIGSIDARYHAVGFGFDTDGDRSDLERILFLYSPTLGTYRAVMTNGSGRRVVARPDVTIDAADAIEARFGIGALGKNVTQYRWFAFAISPDPSNDRCCTDTAPNRQWVRHDLAPPIVESLTFGAVEGQAVPGTPVPATFSFRDVGGSGVDEWRLQAVDITASGAWTHVAAGSGPGPHTVDVTAQAGHTYAVCVVAADDAGNETSEISRFTVPIDDASPSFAYTGSWTTSGSEPGDHMGTRHVGVAGDSLDIVMPVDGAHLAFVLPGGFDGVARLTSDSTDYGVFSGAGMTGSRLLIPIVSGGTFAGRVFHVEIESGTFAIDGFSIEEDFFDPSCPG
jgi:hypothetical protein